MPFFAAFLAPVLLILLGNLVTFCLVMHSLLTSGTRVTSDRKTSGYRRARQGITIMVLLGLTWLFGILVIDDATVAFQYLFSISNTLQGLFVFIFFCILSLETRKQLYSFVRGRYNTPKVSACSLHLVAQSKETLDRECIPNSKTTAVSSGDGDVNCTEPTQLIQTLHL